MSNRVQDQVIVVAGASAGVGRAVVRELAGQGARLGLVARGRAGLEAAADDAKRLGAAAVATTSTDIADAGAVEDAARRLEAELGPIDVWINNAMLSVFAPVTEITEEEFKRVTEVNYLGFVYGTKAALRRMLPRDHGTIVQIGSALAYRGIPLQSAYCASKHALDGFHESLRSELIAASSSVRVSLVHLPALNTPQFGWVRTRLPNHPQPVPPIFQPEVAARGIVWAVQHAPRDLNIGASTVATRIGNALVPSLLDRYLARNAVDDQQTDEPVDPSTWTDNLDAPVDEDVDHGAHGVFGDVAQAHSVHAWLNTHRLLAAAAGAGGAVVVAGAARAVRRALG